MPERNELDVCLYCRRTIMKGSPCRHCYGEIEDGYSPEGVPFLPIAIVGVIALVIVISMLISKFL